MRKSVCLVITLAVGLAGHAAGQEASAEDRLIERVRRKDLEVVSDMQSAGLSIVPRLLRLARHEDREVREIALYCLEQKGGRQARAAFVKALYDRDSQIRAISATRLLQKHHGPENLRALLDVLRRHRDDMVREYIALVVGKIGEPGALPALRKLLEAERNRLVKKNLRLAMARLGDERSRRSILDGLRAQDVETRVRALRGFAFMNDRRLVAHLLPLLGDERDAVNVAPAGHRAFVRICDLAVEVLDAVLLHPFSFQVGNFGRARKYSQAEIDAARRLVENRSGRE